MPTCEFCVQDDVYTEAWAILWRPADKGFDLGFGHKKCAEENGYSPVQGKKYWAQTPPSTEQLVDRVVNVLKLTPDDILLFRSDGVGVDPIIHAKELRDEIQKKLDWDGLIICMGRDDTIEKMTKKDVERMLKMVAEKRKTTMGDLDASDTATSASAVAQPPKRKIDWEKMGTLPLGEPLYKTYLDKEDVTLIAGRNSFGAYAVLVTLPGKK